MKTRKPEPEPESKDAMLARLNAGRTPDEILAHGRAEAAEDLARMAVDLRHAEEWLAENSELDTEDRFVMRCHRNSLVARMRFVEWLVSDEPTSKCPNRKRNPVGA